MQPATIAGDQSRSVGTDTPSSGTAFAEPALFFAADGALTPGTQSPWESSVAYAPGKGSSTLRLVDRPVSNSLGLDLPDTMTMNALLGVYLQEVQTFLTYEQSTHLSPLVGLAAACFASRYLEGFDRERQILFRRTRKAIEPTLAGAVPLTLQNFKCTMLFIAHMATSGDWFELAASQQLVRTLAKRAQDAEFATESAFHRMAGRAPGSKVEEVTNEHRRWFWGLYQVETEMGLVAFQKRTFRELDIDVGLPTLWEDSSSKPIMLDYLSDGIGEFGSMAIIRNAYLHWQMQKIIDNEEEISRTVKKKNGSWIVSMELARKRNQVLVGLENWYNAETRWVSPLSAQGDVFLPMSDSLRHQYTFQPPMLSLTSARHLDVLALKHLTIKVTYHALVAISTAPFQDLYTFVNFTSLNMPIEEWQKLATRLRAWLLLSRGTLTASLIDQGHKQEEVIAAAETASTSLLNAQTTLETVSQILPFCSMVVWQIPQFSWYVLAVSLIDMMRWVLDEEPHSSEAFQRVQHASSWFQCPSVVNSWPVMGTFAFGFHHFLSQVTAFKVALSSVTANTGSEEEASNV